MTNTANEFGIDAPLFLKVLVCESHLDPSAIGDKGTSYGIAQLHNPESDWHITPEQALNARIAVRIAAQAWVKGQQGKWSCYYLMR